MERRAYHAPLNPALAVSGLLTRVSLFLLVVIVPVLAMFSRRSVAILVPVATALLILAAALDGELPRAFGRFGRILASWQALALAVLVVWAGATVVWTPRPWDAAARLSDVVLTLMLFGAAIACLKDRTRRSDVNLIPIGTAVAAMALALEFMPGSPLGSLTGADQGGPESRRAAMLLALLVWPAVASLTAQERSWQAALLVAVTLCALWFVRDLVVIAAFLAGAVVFELGALRPRAGTLAVGGATLAMLVFAPLIGWLMAHYGGFLLPREGDDLVSVWRDVTFSLPSHLVQGFGFEASGALERGTSGVLLGSPRNAALQIWLELGLVGVAMAALALLIALAGIEKVDLKARPAALAVCATAAIMMFAGLAAWQNWWISSLGLTAISLAFLSRRSTRERA
jgi:hypothetical protein